MTTIDLLAKDLSQEFQDAWPILQGEAKLLYGANERHYHVYQHAVGVTKDCGSMAQKFGLSRSNTETLLVGALMHDCIYDPLSKSNESDSAFEAVELCFELGYDRVNETALTSIIRDTTHAFPPETFIGAILCDADLAGLGATAEDYALNGQRIQQEYAAYGVTELQWMVGRDAFLRAMRVRPTIFWTSYWSEYLEDRARVNMAEELRNLQSL